MEKPRDLIELLSDPARIGEKSWQSVIQNAYQTSQFSDEQWNTLIVGIGKNLSALKPATDFWTDVLTPLKKPLLQATDSSRAVFLDHVIDSQKNKGIIHLGDKNFAEIADVYSAYMRSHSLRSKAKLDESLENIQVFTLESGVVDFSVAPGDEELYKEAILLRKIADSYKVASTPPSNAALEQKDSAKPLSRLEALGLNRADSAALFTDMDHKIRETRENIRSLIDELSLEKDKSASLKRLDLKTSKGLAQGGGIGVEDLTTTTLKRNELSRLQGMQGVTPEFLLLSDEFTLRINRNEIGKDGQFIKAIVIPNDKKSDQITLDISEENIEARKLASPALTKLSLRTADTGVWKANKNVDTIKTGVTFVNEGKYKEAISLFRNALASDDFLDDAHIGIIRCELGRALFETQNDAEAIEQLQAGFRIEAIQKLYPHDCRLWAETLGFAQLRMGEYVGAVATFQGLAKSGIVTDKADFGKLHFNLGYSLERAGDNENADETEKANFRENAIKAYGKGINSYWFKKQQPENWVKLGSQLSGLYGKMGKHADAAATEQKRAKSGIFTNEAAVALLHYNIGYLLDIGADSGTADEARMKVFREKALKAYRRAFDSKEFETLRSEDCAKLAQRLSILQRKLRKHADAAATDQKRVNHRFVTDEVKVATLYSNIGNALEKAGLDVEFAEAHRKAAGDKAVEARKKTSGDKATEAERKAAGDKAVEARRRAFCEKAIMAYRKAVDSQTYEKKEREKWTRDLIRLGVLQSSIEKHGDAAVTLQMQADRGIASGKVQVAQLHAKIGFLFEKEADDENTVEAEKTDFREKAITAYGKGLDSNWFKNEQPEYWVIIARRRSRLQRKMGKHADVAVTDQKLAKSGLVTDKVEEAILYDNIGYSLEKAGDAEKADEAARKGFHEKAVKADRIALRSKEYKAKKPKNYDFLAHRLGNLQFSLGKHADAAATFQKRVDSGIVTDEVKVAVLHADIGYLLAAAGEADVADEARRNGFREKAVKAYLKSVSSEAYENKERENWTSDVNQLASLQRILGRHADAALTDEMIRQQHGEHEEGERSVPPPESTSPELPARPDQQESSAPGPARLLAAPSQAERSVPRPESTSSELPARSDQQEPGAPGPAQRSRLRRLLHVPARNAERPSRLARLADVLTPKKKDNQSQGRGSRH